MMILNEIEANKSHIYHTESLINRQPTSNKDRFMTDFTVL
jgi:hypothetical protein